MLPHVMKTHVYPVYLLNNTFKFIFKVQLNLTNMFHTINYDAAVSTCSIQ